MALVYRDNTIFAAVFSHIPIHRCCVKKMFPFRNKVKYSLILDGDTGEKKENSRISSFLQDLTPTKAGVVIVLLFASTVAFIFATGQQVKLLRVGECRNPRIRREWRTLSTPQQLDYIDAVKCLQRKPSKLEVGGSLYDDFPWIHRYVGHTSHDEASFLTWHRYFVHLYETRIREECDYDGPLPYWNWVLDYEDPALSPIFDTELGFGGNGDTALPERALGGGYCVTDGPFAMLTARYIDLEIAPHCLSRNFRNDTATGHFTGQLIRPELIEKTLAVDDLLKFTLKLESGPHNTIPMGIRGDFLSFNAPSDPIFFLHHAQLDRLWWKWQNMKPQRKATFKTKKSAESNEMTSLRDRINMGELGKEISVSEIIDTRKGVLCYVYDDVEG